MEGRRWRRPRARGRPKGRPYRGRRRARPTLNVERPTLADEPPSLRDRAGARSRRLAARHSPTVGGSYVGSLLAPTSRARSAQGPALQRTGLWHREVDQALLAVDLGDDDEDTFLEDDEEENDDVSDMIGVGDDDDES